MKNSAALSLVFLLFASLFCKTALAEDYKVGLQKFEQSDTPQYFVFIYPLIFSKLSEITGDNYHFDYLAPAELKQAYETGKIDIEPGINPVWVTNSQVDSLFTVPFTQTITSIIHLKGHEFDTSDRSLFVDKTLGVVDGYRYPALDDWITKGIIKTETAINQEALLRALMIGKLKHIIVNRQLARYWLEQRNKTDHVVFGEDISKLDVMMRVHPQFADMLPRLNAAITQLVKDGSIKQIYDPFYLKSLSAMEQ